MAKTRGKIVGLLIATAGLLAVTPARAAVDSMFSWTDLKFIRIYHAYSASDGKSYLEEIAIPSYETDSFAKSKAQTYFDFKAPISVRIGRGASGAMYEWHGAVEYRHLIVPLQGEMFFDLGEGRTLNLKPGEAILAEDWTGRGHRSGCAESKTVPTCLGMDILIDRNPRAMPLRAPPKP